jgi:uncharacterized protein (DUF433 family)
MLAELRQHIELNGDNPLDATIIGRRSKAYLVAGYAFGFSPEEAAEHYGLTLGDIYAAMAFYHDNQAAIEAAIAEARAIGYSIGARDSSDVIAELKARMDKKEKNSD